jgi:hypothetical protein
MFTLANLNAFRYHDGEDDCTVATEVVDAWFVFLNDFCRLVSYEWNEYLKNLMNQEAATFFQTLTTSDEAFCEWTVTCKYEEMQQQAEEIKSKGLNNWMVERKKRKRGPHDSRQKIDLYSRIYKRIEQHRKNKVANAKWQKLFFDRYFKEKLESLLDETDNEDDTSTSTRIFYIPTLDGEGDGFLEEQGPLFSV